MLDERNLSKHKGEKLTDPLSAQLHAALEASRRSHEIYRQKFVKRWVVEFIDVSKTSKGLLGQLDTNPAMVFRELQAVVRPVLERHKPTYMSNTLDSPQVTVCFEKPGQAAEAAIEVQHVLMTWDAAQETPRHLMPSIGMHIGDVVYNRGELQQSNACNLAKRVQTEAKSGQIFLSKAVREALEENPRYTMKFVRRAELKNIPLPQDIYELNWKDIEVDADHPAEKVVAVEGFSQRHVIFYIDVCESTRKFWTLGDRMGNELIKDYRNIVEPVVKKHGCSYQESSEGDQVMACFPGRQPRRAAEAATEIQRVLFRRNSCLDAKKRLRAAIGLHIGDIVRQRKEIVQTADFQICKGIQEQAGADEIFISKTLYEIFEEEDRYDMRFVGTSDLKGVPEPQDIYRIIWHTSEDRVRQSVERRKIEKGIERLTRMKRR